MNEFSEGMSVEAAAQLEAAKKVMLAKVLDKAAMERLGRVRLANPSLAMQLEAYLLQLSQSGQLKEQINDEKLRKILDVVTEKKRATKIKRK